MISDGKTVAVVQTMRARIDSGSLTRGERLPSIRRLAAQLCVSPSTISEAYERLVAEGMISARPGSGYFVCATRRDEPGKPARRDYAVDPFWVSRQALEADPVILQPGCGWLPESWMPQSLLRQGLREVAKTGGALLTGYGPAAGAMALRRVLARRWAETQLYVPPEQILLSGSGTQAVDLVCRLLLKPGDCVLVDDPCYFNFRALLAVHQVRVIGIPFTVSGPDLDLFAEVAIREKPRLYLTNSGLQNPTGAALTLARAHALLVLAQRHDLHIVEDDIFADFVPHQSASLAPLDGLDRVIRVGSFSKTLSASLRCGYVAASPGIIEALGDLQIATGFAGVSPVAAQIVQHVLKAGSYRRHLETLNRRLTRSRRECAERLTAIGIKPWIMPEGGFSLWCQMPERCNVSLLAQIALQEDLILAPGAVFSDSPVAMNYMRFNVAQMTDPAIFDRLEALMIQADKAGPTARPALPSNQLY